MARRLGAENNEFIMDDKLSNSQIVFYYRMPTTKERVAFSRACFKKKGEKIVPTYYEARVTYGIKILEGIRDGDFEVRDADKKWIPVSSDSTSENYHPDWKALVEVKASDLVAFFASQIYEEPVTAARSSVDLEEEEEEEEEDQD